MDDEQENTCDPPGTPLPETESKDSEEKLVDPLQITNSAGDKEAQDYDAVQEPSASKASAATDAKEMEATTSDATDSTSKPLVDGTDEKPKLPSGSAVSSVTATVTTAAVSSTVTSSTFTATTSPELEPTKCEPVAALPIVPKEQEMLSTIANIKQEINAPTNNLEYPPKEIPVFIKKEPSEDTADTSNSNSNSNSNEPHDLKLASDIKSEGKCGLDLTDHDNKYPESAAGTPGQPKFGSNLPGPPPPLPSATDAQSKYPPEPSKYTEPHKYQPHDSHPGMKYPPGTPEHGKYLLDPSKCEVKGYLDLNNRYHEGPPKSYSDGAINEHPQSLKVYPPEQQQPTDLKYSAAENHNKYTPPISEPLKYESGDNAAIKRPPYPDLHQPIRSPYDPSQMIKYGDPMQKFHGLPPHMSVAGFPEMKHLPSADLKYRPPEGLTKPPFSTDALIKSNAYGEYGALKYPPSESPIDASARSTPNQDSQSSNSNLPPHLPTHHGNTSSPQTNSPHLNHLPPGGGPPLLLGPGAPGMLPHPVSLAHLPATHPSMAPPNSSPSATPVSNPPSHLPPSTVSSPMQQPLGLLAHPGIHRPHQDMPPLMHHPSAPFATGLPPPHSSAHPQIPSPALSVSRSEHERAEQRRIESMHHGSSPGLLPPTAGAPLLGHPPIPLHLTGSMPPTGMLICVENDHSELFIFSQCRTDNR